MNHCRQAMPQTRQCYKFLSLMLWVETKLLNSVPNRGRNLSNYWTSFITHWGSTFLNIGYVRSFLHLLCVCERERKKLCYRYIYNFKLIFTLKCTHCSVELWVFLYGFYLFPQKLTINPSFINVSHVAPFRHKCVLLGLIHNKPLGEINFIYIIMLLTISGLEQ